MARPGWKARSSGMARPDQSPQILGQPVISGRRRREQARSTLTVEYEYGAAVVDGVVPVTVGWIAPIGDSVSASHCGQLSIASGKPNDLRTERGHVALQNLGRIALRIDRDEKDAHPVRLRPQLLQRRRDVGQCHGARVRTLCVAEVKQRRLTAQVGCGEASPGPRGQLELEPWQDACDVLGVKAG